MIKDMILFSQRYNGIQRNFNPKNSVLSLISNDLIEYKLQLWVQMSISNELATTKVILFTKYFIINIKFIYMQNNNNNKFSHVYMHVFIHKSMFACMFLSINSIIKHFKHGNYTLIPYIIALLTFIALMLQISINLVFYFIINKDMYFCKSVP